MKHITIILVTIFFVFSLNEEKPIAKFEIEVVSMYPKIELKSIKGCNWETLSFTAKSYQTFVIDQTGVSFLKTPYSTAFNKSSFAFKASRAEGGLKMESIKGTAWKSLSFDRKPFSKLIINETGVHKK